MFCPQILSKCIIVHQGPGRKATWKTLLILKCSHMSHAQMFVVNCNDDVTLDKLMVGRLFLFWKEGKNVKQCCFETLKSFSCPFHKKVSDFSFYSPYLRLKKCQVRYAGVRKTKTKHKQTNRQSSF